MQDYVYQQNPDGSYLIEKGELVTRNRNEVVDTLLMILKSIYKNIVSSKKVPIEAPLCYEQLLDQALARYSRDVFGESRLNAKIEAIRSLGRVVPEVLDSLEKYHEYGIKIDSCQPYIHRQIAVLLYWLSSLKPFTIKAGVTSIQKLGDAYDYHNEYISYMLIQILLKTCNCELTIHENREIFHDFLYDLHFRRLSRSSLEFMLAPYIRTLS
jgi:hypothetical protein